VKVESHLNNKEIESLRSSGLINNQEVAVKVGDLIVAENIITRQRRVITDAHKFLSESNKRLLKG